MAFKLFGDVYIKYHLYIGVYLQRNVWVHMKNEMEAFIRFKGVDPHQFFGGINLQ